MRNIAWGILIEEEVGDRERSGVATIVVTSPGRMKLWLTTYFPMRVVPV